MGNITSIVFDKESAKTIYKDLWQYDYGQILRIEGLNLPKAVEIHFSLQETGGEAKRRIGITDSGVTDVVIPDFILEGNKTTRDYYAYAFIYVSSEESGETTHKIKMRIISRPKPEDYISSSDDVKTWEKLEKRIAEFEKNGVSEEQIALAVESYMVKNPPQVAIDTELSEKSSNPVQNKVITQSLKQVETTIGNIDVLLGTI